MRVNGIFVFLVYLFSIYTPDVLCIRYSWVPRNTGTERRTWLTGWVHFSISVCKCVWVWSMCEYCTLNFSSVL